MENSNFNAEINTYQSTLKSFAIHFTKNLEDANDLVQETLLKAITYRDLYQDGTNLKAWLYTIMKNTYINGYRRATQKQSLIYTTDEITSAYLLKSSMHNRAGNTFVNEDIVKALNKLDVHHSTPFLRYFEGYKYHEIAEELNIPIGTVKTRIFIARKLLKKSLKMYKNGYNLPVN